MKIDVDRSLCTGIGMCESYAPELFEIDDDGVLMLLSEEVSGDAVRDVEVAVQACPTAALRLRQ